MNLYLDTSALVKRYVKEPGSDDARAWIRAARIKTTVIITRAEVAAALTRALRMNTISKVDYDFALSKFRSDWIDFQRLSVTERLVARADRLACEFGLRGYDAVHLAAADLWQDALGEVVTFAVFDAKLWHAARKIGLIALPKRLHARRQQ
jgi:predicted nucleic acid-binding protein